MSIAPTRRPGTRPQRRTLRRAAAALTAVTALFGGTAAAASATSYGEVVSRAWGADGAAPSVVAGSAGAVSDNGRLTAYSGDPTGVGFGPNGDRIPDLLLYVRDIVNNRTFQVTNHDFAFATSIDNTGRYVAYTLASSAAWSDPTTATSSLYIYDAARQTSTLVARATGAGGAAAIKAHGLISGDGKSVVFTSTDVPGSGPGLYRRTLATNVTTRLGDLPPLPPTQPEGGSPFNSPDALRASITSVSDNGSVVTLQQDPQVGAGGLIVTAARRDTVDGLPRVSADGSTVAYRLTPAQGDAKIVFRSVATGAEQATSLPDAAGGSTAGASGDVAWIGPNGKQAAVAPHRPFFGFTTTWPAQLLDRASGIWSPAGPYATQMFAGTTNILGLFSPTPISRDGQYTLFNAFDPERTYEQSKAIVIGDNRGAALPGGSDHPPASVYVHVNVGNCVGDTDVPLRIGLKPAFLEPIKSLKGTMWVDGQYVGEQTFTDDAEQTLKMPADTKVITVKATATFQNGQSTTGTYDTPVHTRTC